MIGEELIEEGRRLARPCTYLRTVGEEPAAVWGGDGIVPCGEGPYRHWLTIDRRFLPFGDDSTGCLSVYTNVKDLRTGIVAVDDGMTLSETGGLRLFAHRVLSLPPIDAVLRFGSADVRDWLASFGWGPESGYNDNFPDWEPVEVYEDAYRNQLPLYSGGTHAVLGGWHMTWPDDDWVELIDKRLIVWTFEESEPWVEVWEDEDGFRVMQRIT